MFCDEICEKFSDDFESHEECSESLISSQNFVINRSTFLNCPLHSKNLDIEYFFGLAIFTVFTHNRRFLALFEVGIEPPCN